MWPCPPQRGAKADAIRSYESALRLNPRLTTPEKQNADAATRALEELRRGFATRQSARLIIPANDPSLIAPLALRVKSSFAR